MLTHISSVSLLLVAFLRRDLLMTLSALFFLLLCLAWLWHLYWLRHTSPHSRVEAIHTKIQRLRHRYQLPRLPKRSAPCRPARRLTRKVKQEARRLLEAKPGLDPERLAWELQNVAQLQISPATIKRMKHAMRQAQTPPPLLPLPKGAK